MSQTIDIARLILEAETKGFADAKADVASTEGALAALSASYKSGSIDIDEYLRKSQQLRSHLEAIRAALKLAEDAQRRYGTATKAAGELAKQSTAAGKNYGMGIMQVSYAIQDFTSANGDLLRGLMSVQNNIPGLLTSLGVGSGVAGAVSMITVGIGLALPRIQEYGKSLGLWKEKVDDAKDAIGQLQDHIKDLESHPTKLAVDLAEIEAAEKKVKELQAGMAAYKAAAEGKSEYEKKAGDQVKEILDKEGEEGRVIAQKLRARKAVEIANSDPQLAEARAEVKKIEDKIGSMREHARELRNSHDSKDTELARALTMEADTREGDLPAAREKAMMIYHNIVKADEHGKAAQEIGALMAKAESGIDPHAREELSRRLREIGEDSTADAIDVSTPEKILELESIEERLEDQIKEMAAARKRNTERAHRKVGDALKLITQTPALGKAAFQLLRGIDEDHVGTGPDGKQVPLESDEARLEFFKGKIQEMLTKELESRGLPTEYSRSQIKGAAEQVAGQAKGNLQRQRHAELESDRSQVQMFIEREDASIKSGGYDTRAEALLARALAFRAQGGAGNPFGRMTDSQIMDYVRSAVAMDLHRVMAYDPHSGRPIRANPQMDREQTNDVATKVTAMAGENLQHHMIGLNATNMGNTQRLLTIASQLDGEVAQLQAHAAEISAGISNVEQSARARARSANKR